MKQDRFAGVEAEALRLHDEWWLDTIRFFRNSRKIYQRYGDWKDAYRFYFIPLRVNMSYTIAGHIASMAYGRVWLGTFVRTTLEHPELFTAPCPECGATLYPFGYNGSPLSGRVDLESSCACGWEGYVTVRGWRVRSEALKAEQKRDRRKLWRARVFKGFGEPATVAELLETLR